jgi:hypothetical protein
MKTILFVAIASFVACNACKSCDSPTVAVSADSGVDAPVITDAGSDVVDSSIEQ